MSYLEKKILLVKDFGVIKAQRATTSLITNKVEDKDVINKDGRGARDKNIMAMAEQLEKEI
jgi:hypothetical protein